MPAASSEQLHELVGMLVGVAGTPAAPGPLVGGGSAAESVVAATRAAARERALILLSTALAASRLDAGGRLDTDVLGELLRLSAPGEAAPAAEAGVEVACAREAPSLEEAAAGQERLLGQQQPRPRAASAAVGAAGQGGSKRWKRAAAWQPCAIGCLPSVHDANGRLPSVDAALALAPPQQQEEQPAVASRQLLEAEMAAAVPQQQPEAALEQPAGQQAEQQAAQQSAPAEQQSPSPSVSEGADAVADPPAAGGPPLGPLGIEGAASPGGGGGAWVLGRWQLQQQQVAELRTGMRLL
jgi:hypothetical protein